MLAAVLTTVLLSISVVSGSRASRLLGGTEANFWRLVVACVLLAGWAYGFGIGLEGPAFPMFLLSGIVGIGFGDLALFQALPRLGSRRTSLINQCLTAPFAALLEWVWMGTRLSAGQMACGIVILAGVGLALTPTEHIRLNRRQWLLGVVFSVLAALGGAGGAVLSRRAYLVVHAAHETIDPVNAGFQRVLGGTFLAGLCLLAAKWQARRLMALRVPEEAAPDRAANWRLGWPWVVLNGLAGQTLGVSSMQWALESTSAGIVMSVIAVTPLVVIPFAIQVEGERPGMRALVGGIIAVAGVIVLIGLR